MIKETILIDVPKLKGNIYVGSLRKEIPYHCLSFNNIDLTEEIRLIKENYKDIKVKQNLIVFYYRKDLVQFLVLDVAIY